MVRAEGIEPPHLSILEPKSSASTSSATRAAQEAAAYNRPCRLGNPERAGSLGFQGDLKCKRRRGSRNRRSLLRRRRKNRAETRTSTCPRRRRLGIRLIRDRSRQSARRGSTKQRRMSAFDPLRTLNVGGYPSGMKTRIAAEPASGEAPYAHLKPIVEALLEAGNEPSPPSGGHVPNRLGFYHDKDGWRCDLLRPIDFELLYRIFELPPSLSLN